MYNKNSDYSLRSDAPRNKHGIPVYSQSVRIKPLMKRFIDAGVPREDMSHFEDDLYVPVTDTTTRIIKQWCNDLKINPVAACPMFKDKDTGVMMYECRYQYSDWQDVQRRTASRPREERVYDIPDDSDEVAGTQNAANTQKENEEEFENLLFADLVKPRGQANYVSKSEIEFWKTKRY